MSTRRHLLTLLSLPFLAQAPDAQTLFGLEAGGLLTEWAGPPNPASGYPSGFPRLTFPHTVGPCPAPPLPAPPSVLGDVAVDRATNLTWMTNGDVFIAFDQKGGYVDAFVLPIGSVLAGPLTGLGIDSASGRFWITDGVGFASILPGTACAIGAVVVDPPLALPIGGLATDIDIDPGTGLLFVCDTNGFVTNINPATGAVGPFGAFVPAPACPFGVQLQGLAVDRSSPGALYVTDGQRVFYSNFAGAPAPPTFYSPVNCYPVPGAPILGLAQSSHFVAYGPALNTCDGCPPPVLRVLGQMSAGSTVTVKVQNGEPATDVPILFFGFVPTPPIPLGLGGALLLAPAGNVLMPAFPAAAACSSESALTIGLPALPGAPIHLQSLVLQPAGPCLKSTRAMHATLAL